MTHPRGKTAIVGLGMARLGHAPGFAAVELMGIASLRAVADAGLALSDIDAVFAASSQHLWAALNLTKHLGLQPRHFGGTNIGGASFEMHLLEATLAIEAGLCQTALIAYGSNQRLAFGRLVSMSEPQWHEVPYAYRHPMTAYALAASRHMHEFGTTRENLAEVALAARAWANLNPDAFARGPLSLEEVLSAPMVCDPLTAADCCLVTDGAAAVVLTGARQARDLAAKPVYFLGAAASAHRSIVAMPDLTTTAAADSGARAFALAGARHGDVDLVMLYDAFTINTILFLEDLGFCPKGEGGRFVGEGRIAPGGALPTNTNGGGLSCVHPGMYGLFLIAEAVTQIRDEAGARQLKRADLALVHGNGGALSAQVTAFLGSRDTL